MWRDCGLLEREREIDLLDDSLRRAREGKGRLVLIEGEQGSGKTSLLHALRTAAEERGFRVLRACGSEFESDFSWAVLRQLFCDAADGERSEGAYRNSGAASIEKVLSGCGAGEGATGPVATDLHPAFRSMFGTCREISAAEPLLLIIDEAQWGDVESMRFLAYLANRIEDYGILIVLTATCAKRGPISDLLMTASASASASYHRLSPLTREGARRQIVERVGREVPESVLRTCFELTEGNPLHLAELLDEIVGQGLEPDEAAVAVISLITPVRISWNVGSRLRKLPANATVLAEAIAVLDDQAEPRHCVGVTGLGEAELLDAAGCLRDADVLRPGTPYRFRHPVVRQVTYTQMSPRDRGSVHRRSARTLQAAGASAREVAEHLVRTDPLGDTWSVSVLHSASSGAMKEGDPNAAIRYLRHALAEPLSEERELATLARLGSAELRAHDPSAIERLREVKTRGGEPEGRRLVRTELGVALAASARYEEALILLGQDREQMPEDTRAFAAVLSRLAPSMSERTHPSFVPSGGTRSRAAVEALLRCAPLRRVRRLASAALSAGEREALHDTGLTPGSIAAWALSECDELDGAERALDDQLRRATRAGQLLTVDTVRSLRARVLYSSGRLAEAEAAARSVLRHQRATSLRPLSVPLAAAVLVHCLVDTCRPDEAEAFLGKTGLSGELPEAAMFLPLRAARGRLRIRLDRFDDGLADIRSYRELAARHGWWHPSAVCDYLSDGVRAVVRSDGSEQAIDLVTDELARARAFGAARPLAVTLRTYGELQGGAGGLALIEQAQSMLAGLPDTLEHARTLIALGAARRRAGQRSEARRRLTAGMNLAGSIGAVDLENEARQELRLAGSRSVRGEVSAPVPLTPAEERVAWQAAKGLSNREIAQALFVTVKTVEWHLSQTYAKLGIGRRSELPDVLDPASDAENTARSA
ncbi:DUF2791 family P-loop domain-containing protein (plasmid) [Streptomyces anulatus]|uniref:ATP-binding protein n=1 Tax=Streptomyces anulatus TaxID=1892 RepID=UPI001674A9F5|nr:LuxR family transcriptional regulator [Streptomyces anulatus]WSC66787.1 DUF2791 family P-loop domain-containing protein [Streptomyces anulatus]